MKFEQALNDARDGKLIARADWPASRPAAGRAKSPAAGARSNGGC